MADGRSRITNASVDDIEKLYKSLERKLARVKAMLDDFEKANKAKLRLQYLNSGNEAETKLEAFVRGLEKSD